VVELEIPSPVLTEPQTVLHLYAALIRPELFALLVQKTVELGVASITPLITERTVRASFNKKRLETIAREAAELSGRGRVPLINEPRLLPALLVDLKNSTGWLVADRGGKEIKSLNVIDAGYSLCIGPEGGWTDQERNLFKQQAIPAVSLGSTVLRAETAAIVGCFALLNHL
jgi:16S rRNA (uracil1498-N3)-methyltransferase